ncbi:hypothetical protein L3X38_018505 [Prunus dulcis]|uniref:Retrotransposon Copia-like N-terminal domain-containing protein n=1 Tax=Prunus dulcis TaxID=3755 RepID=A0AAD4ZBP5_PRUDU|nr:hypothetical protein L3X38_018505 [Prunus dulcis]
MGDVLFLINGDSSTSTPQIVTIQSDSFSLPANIILTETNYALWSQVMEMRIAACKKLGYLTGDIPKPLELLPTYNKWYTENFRFKGWLIDSMSPDLMSRFIRLSTAKEIWAAVKKTYYDGRDETYLFSHNKQGSTIKHNGVPVYKYYNQLQGMFEIDHWSPIQMHFENTYRIP